MLRTGMGARSPVEVEVGSARVLRAPATCVLPLHAVCASQLLGGCNTLLPVASAARNRQECKRSRIRGHQWTLCAFTGNDRYPDHHYPSPHGHAHRTCFSVTVTITEESGQS